MKKKILGLFFIIISIVFILFIPKASAADLDEIQNYTITVDMKQDGSMDLKYHIEWKVLDSVTEGPLEWVQIGVANKNVKNIKKLSDNIKKIKYNYNYGDYVRIDFKKKYYAGETVSFDFSLNQSYMYQINSNGTCTYTFTPGWFEDINVKKATIKWNKNSVLDYTKGAKEEQGYLVWTKQLNKGQKMQVKVNYYQSAFKLDANKQASNVKSSNGNSIMAILIVIFVVSIIFSIMGSISGGGSYYRHGGFGYYPRYRYYHHHHHHGGFGGGGRWRWLCLCKLCLRLCVCWRRKSRMF